MQNCRKEKQRAYPMTTGKKKITKTVGLELRRIRNKATPLQCPWKSEFVHGLGETLENYKHVATSRCLEGGDVRDRF